MRELQLVAKAITLDTSANVAAIDGLRIEQSNGGGTYTVTLFLPQCNQFYQWHESPHLNVRRERDGESVYSTEIVCTQTIKSVQTIRGVKSEGKEGWGQPHAQD